MRYFKNKQERVGVCNICKNYRELTWDHVPPQGGIYSVPVEIESAFVYLYPNEKRNFFISQNGCKYRTLCKECNSLLGSKYDYIINSLNRTLLTINKLDLYFPNRIEYITSPVSLMKGLLGHLLASKIILTESEIDPLIRECVFDDDKPIPDNIHIFYWLYPYNQTTIIHDIAMPIRRGTISSMTIFSILKFFPIAYLITDIPHYEDLESLSKYRNLGLRDTCKIPIRLNQMKSINWPENTDDNNFILYQKNSSNNLTAKPKVKNK